MPVMNAPFVLREIGAALQKLMETGESRTLYLSQFPMTEEDLEFLRTTLGAGQVVVTDHSAEPVIWRGTAVPAVWWGEYYASPTLLRLRTIEIAPFPPLAAAPPEDIQQGWEELTRKLVLPEEPCTKPV